MKKLSRILGPIAVLAVCIVIALFLMKTAPEAKRRTPKPVIPVVEVIEVQPTEYRIRIHSQGTVMPQTKSTLVSEVAGRIIEVSTDLRNGSVFQRDQTLVRIDQSEYLLTVANIEASLAGVEARLKELETTEQNLKKSRAIETQHLKLTERQFTRHSKLHKQGTVAQSLLEQNEREYLLRKASLQNLENSLQLIPAQRSLLLSEQNLKQAQLETAQLNLARTRIVAPYDGRVLEKLVDIGQSVSKGTVLATLYATDSIEVRLPVTDREASFLNLNQSGEPPQVTISATLGSQRHQWQGRIVRSEAAIDTRTRQQFLVAQVDAPYSASEEGRPPLDIGQFVEAEIPGQLLSNVFILPREAVRAGNQVLVITPDQRIQRRGLDLLWGDRESVVVRSGISAGERISLTALPYAPEGSKVKISNEPKDKASSKGKR